MGFVMKWWAIKRADGSWVLDKGGAPKLHKWKSYAKQAWLTATARRGDKIVEVEIKEVES